MAEDTKTPEATAVQGDEIKNLKSEIDRKMGNQSDQFKQLLEANRALATQVQQLAEYSKPKPKPVAEQNQALEDLIYDNPAKAVEIMEQRVEARVAEKEKKKEAVQFENQQVINKIVLDYPEVNDASHGLTKRAAEIIQTYPEHRRSDANVWRTSVLEAASEQGVKPMSRRDNDDSFSVGGGSSSEGKSKKRKKDDEIDPRTLAFAEAIGQDVKDPKYIEKLEKIIKDRKSWTKYE